MSGKRLVMGEMRRDSDNAYAMFGPLMVDGDNVVAAVQGKIEEARIAEGISYGVQVVLIMDVISGNLLYDAHQHEE